MKSSTIHYSTSGIVALVLLAADWGAGPTVTRYLSGGLGLYEQWYLRYAIGFVVGVLLFGRYFSFRKFLHLPAQEWAVLLFRTVIGQVVAIALFTLAVQRAKVGLIAFIHVLPMCSVLGILLFHEKLSWRRGVLLTLSFVGAAIVVVGSPGDLFDINFGALLALVGLVFYAFMLVTRRWHTNALNNHEISVALTGIGGVVMYGLSVVLYHRWMIPVDHWNSGFTAILVVAGCLVIASNFLSNYGFEHVSAVIASNILALEAVFGTLFGFVFYRELLSGRDIVGGLIILASVILTNQVARREHRAVLPIIVPE